MMQNEKSGLKLTVSVPPELPNKVNLTVSGHYTGEHCLYDKQNNKSTVEFDLPVGKHAGESVTRMLVQKG